MKRRQARDYRGRRAAKRRLVRELRRHGASYDQIGATLHALKQLRA